MFLNASLLVCSRWSKLKRWEYFQLWKYCINQSLYRKNTLFMSTAFSLFSIIAVTLLCAALTMLSTEVFSLIPLSQFLTPATNKLHTLQKKWHADLQLKWTENLLPHTGTQLLHCCMWGDRYATRFAFYNKKPVLFLMQEEVSKVSFPLFKVFKIISI